MEVIMLAIALVLIMVLPVALLTAPLDILFSPDELNEMGVSLEYPSAECY
jgi:hypothetical protein